MVKPVLLPTDVAFLSSLLLVGLYFWAVRRDLLMRERWRTVLATPTGGAAALILCLYVAVAGLDCLRVEINGETKSLLDYLVSPLREHVETTYSAPFAAYGYAREVIPGASGAARQDYPRLRYGARHLAQPSRQMHADVLRRGMAGAGLGLLFLGGLLALVNRLRGRPLAGMFTPLTESTWRLQWLTAASICLALGWVICLAPYYHVLGTDKVGNDVLYLTLKSIRTGLVLGVVSSFITLPLAVIFGIPAGYFGGWIDDLVQYLYTTFSSVPGVLLIASAALSLDLLLQQHASAFPSLLARADMKLLALCLVLGLTGWTGLCRLLRADVMKLRVAEFVTAARALGTPPLKILLQHLLPNTFHLILITTVLDFSGLVLAEAVLTYVDIGVDPSMESWGNMINGARLELAREPAVWWSLLAAFCGMLGLVLAANLFADAMRDAFDPKLRGATSPSSS